LKGTAHEEIDTIIQFSKYPDSLHWTITTTNSDRRFQYFSSQFAYSEWILFYFFWGHSFDEPLHSASPLVPLVLAIHIPHVVLILLEHPPNDLQRQALLVQQQ
jgi:hypothetical protein